MKILNKIYEIYFNDKLTEFMPLKNHVKLNEKTN